MGIIGINIVCDICGNKLPIMGEKQNKVTKTVRVGLCGYCETMATIISRKLKEAAELKAEAKAQLNEDILNYMGPEYH